MSEYEGKKWAKIFTFMGDFHSQLRKMMELFSDQIIKSGFVIYPGKVCIECESDDNKYKYFEKTRIYFRESAESDDFRTIDRHYQLSMYFYKQEEIQPTGCFSMFSRNMPGECPVWAIDKELSNYLADIVVNKANSSCVGDVPVGDYEKLGISASEYNRVSICPFPFLSLKKPEDVRDLVQVVTPCLRDGRMEILLSNKGFVEKFAF